MEITFEIENLETDDANSWIVTAFCNGYSATASGRDLGKARMQAADRVKNKLNKLFTPGSKDWENSIESKLAKIQIEEICLDYAF